MQYHRDKQWRQASKITGPKHNFLGLLLTTNSLTGTEPKLEKVAVSEGQERIDPRDLVAQVISGVDDANREFGSHFSVLSIKYAVDDTPAKGVYRSLARTIVKRAVAEESTSEHRLAAG